MERKNCIIVHGCADNEEDAAHKHWMPWLQRELIAHGIPTDAPVMPKSWAPNYDAYKAEMEKYDVNEGTVLVGHSCGCAFLVRWLGEAKKNIAKLVLVAPWKIPDEHSEVKKLFYTYPIDGTIASRVGEMVMFTADDEEEDGKKSVQIFHDALGGRVIELKGHGHYCLGDMGTEEFPELLDVITK